MSFEMSSRHATEQLSDTSSWTLCTCCDEEVEEFSGQMAESAKSFDVTRTQDAICTQFTCNRQVSPADHGICENELLSLGDVDENDCKTFSDIQRKNREIDRSYRSTAMSDMKERAGEQGGKVGTRFWNRLGELWLPRDQIPTSALSTMPEIEEHLEEASPWDRSYGRSCVSSVLNFTEVNTDNDLDRSFTTEFKPTNKPRGEESIYSTAEALPKYENTQSRHDKDNDSGINIEVEYHHYKEDQNEDEMISSTSESSESDCPINPVGFTFRSSQSLSLFPTPQAYYTYAPYLSTLPCSRDYGMQLKMLEEENKRRLEACRMEQSSLFDAEIPISCKKEHVDDCHHEMERLQDITAAQIDFEVQRRMRREENNREPEDLLHKSPFQPRQVCNAWTQVDEELPQPIRQYSFSITTTEDQTTVQGDNNLNIEHVTTVTEKNRDAVKTITTIQFLDQAFRRESHANTTTGSLGTQSQAYLTGANNATISFSSQCRDTS